jgi:hypothetical protein
MVDEWPIIERRVKSDRMVLKKTEAAAQFEVESVVDRDIEFDLELDGTSPHTEQKEPGEGRIKLSSDEREVLNLVDGKRTAAEISERTTLGEFDTYRILADLLTRNLIDEVKRPTATDAATKKRGTLDHLLQGTLNSIILLAVLAALATLNANPLSPWRLAGENEGTIKLRYYASHARLERIEGAIQVFYLDAGVLPPTLEPLASNGYVKETDLIDPWGRPYGYVVSPGGYQLFGMDADGNPSSELTLAHSFNTVQRMLLDQEPTPPEPSAED